MTNQSEFTEDTKMKKRITSTIVLILSLSAFAANLYAGTYSGGTGEPDNPYQIAAVADWQELMATPADWNKCFLLTADIDLGGITIIPIGTNYSNSFTGVFNGQGFVIRNVVINLPDSDFIGIFGFVRGGAQIRNLGLDNVNVTGRSYVGGLVGGTESGSITGCSVAVIVNGVTLVGGLMGFNDKGLINSCYSSGTVNGTWDAVGGLVGGNYNGPAICCYSTANVTGTGRYVGGLAGVNHSSIICCYSTGTVSAKGYVGGLVGVNNSSAGLITSCYSTGAVNGTGKYVGGLVGSHSYGSISFSYSTGSVSGTSYVGGLTGSNTEGFITSCFWDIQTSGQATSAGGTGKTTVEMQTQPTYLNVGWDFVGESANGLHDFWQIAPNDYPSFAVPDWTLAGNGTADSPYLVESVADLAKVWLRPNADYRLNANLDLSGISWSTAIISQFTGVFDGNGFVIRNAVINLPDRDYIGIFGYVGDGGQIQNLGVENMNITGRSYVGGLVGLNDSGSIIDCKSAGTVSGADYYVGGLVGRNYTGSITGCNSAGTVNGTGYFTGGLVGYIDSGSITSCHSTADVNGKADVGGLAGQNQAWIVNSYSTGNVNGTGDSVGGLVGLSDSGRSITHCYSTGNVSGPNRVGGLVGSNEMPITFCHSTGSVSGANSVGGLVGENFASIAFCHSKGSVIGASDIGGLIGSNSGSITFCYSMDSVNGTSDVGGLVGSHSYNSINFCYSTGSVSGTSYVGGLAGSNTEGSITSCFWDTQTSGQATSDGGTGKTTAEMQTQATYLNAGWDFIGESKNGLHDFWQIATNDYPHFAASEWTLAGDGTADSPYLVETPADLAKVWLRPDACYRLTGNLDLSGIYWTTAIIPEFAGVFDGNDHVIRNAVINQPDEDWIGIFGYVDFSGQIKNLGVADVNITGSSGVGGLAGENNGSITSCYSTGTVNGDYNGAGGLVGVNSRGSITSCYSTGTVSGGSFIGGLAGYNDSASITSCYSTETVSGTDDRVGGLVGYNTSAAITSCHSTGNVSGIDGYVGGLVGWNSSSSITSSYSTGNVTSGGNYVGGLVGISSVEPYHEEFSPISFCYSTGKVSGDSFVGGLVGLNFSNHYGDPAIISSCSIGSADGTGDYVGGLVGFNGSGLIISCYSTADANGNSYVGGLVGRGRDWLTDCYSTGSVSGASNVGGLVGENDESVISCFWDIQTSGQTTSDGGTGKTTAEMQTLATFLDAGWDFVCETASGADDIWFMLPDDYPRLTWEYTPEFDLSVSPTILWPANHKMVKITPAWTATDLCGQPLEVSLVDITANKPCNPDDIKIAPDGSISLCATRSGNSKGRIYTLVFQACDSTGNCTTKTATVTVPHDMRK